MWERDAQRHIRLATDCSAEYPLCTASGRTDPAALAVSAAPADATAVAPVPVEHEA